MTDRQYSLADRLISQVDMALRAVTPNVVSGERPSPGDEHEPTRLEETQQRHIAGLMRINHTGEVCAQALYQGQALTAKLDDVREAMEHAAQEEVDHLAWCEQRVNELGSHISMLNPLWYGLSFGIGAAAGVAGDRWSLGFVAETEQQVCEHLQTHLDQVPRKDERTRAILKQMKEDEAQHGATAKNAGGRDLPPPVKGMMKLMSKVMTTTTYRI